MAVESERRRLRLALIATATAACMAGGGWWLVSRAPTTEPRSASPVAALPRAEERAPPKLAAAPQVAAPDDSGLAAMETPHEDAAPEGVETDAAYPLAPSDGPVLLRVTYGGAGEPPALLEIQATPDENYDATVRLLLAKGTLEGRLPAAKRYRLEFLFDGWGGLPPTQVSVPPESTLAVELTPPQSPTLRILDAATLSPIATAQVFRTDWLDSGTSAPTTRDSTPNGADAQGRVVLPKMLTPTDVWVGAEGYAWVRTSVDPGDRDRPIALAPGGGLRVMVDGVTDWSSLRVLAVPIRGPSSEADAEGFFDSGEVELRAGDVQGHYERTGLRPGPWRVRIGWSVSRLHMETLQSVDTTIGEREVREIGVRVSLPAATQGFRLEVVVPAAWGSPPRLDVDGIGGVARGASFRRVPLIEGPAGTWVAQFQRLSPGLYQVSIDAFHFSRMLRVAAATTTARIEVPPPISLRVRLVDERSGASLTDAVVTGGSAPPFYDASSPADSDTPDPTKLTPADLEGGFSWSGSGSGRATQDAATGEYVLRAPAGLVFVRVTAPGYIDAHMRLDAPATAPETRTEVRVTRGGTIHLRVVRGGSLSTTASGSWSLDAVAAEGWDAEQEWIRGGDFSGGTMRLDGLTPGRYRVHLGMTGVEKELTQEVDVRAGEEKTVDFELPVK